MRQYLLGSLSEDLQQRVEERLLTEEVFFEELLLGEEELIDEYINDTLSSEDRDSFERHFLSTAERHQKLRFGRVLSRYISEKSEDAFVEREDVRDQPIVAKPPTGPTWAERVRAFWSRQAWGLRTALTLALIVVMAGALWMWRPRTPTPRTLATLNLTMSAGNRAEGAQASRVKLTPDVDALRISLTLPERTTPAVSYRVELVDDNRETGTLEISEQDARSVSVVIPAARLARGEYALRLYMTKADGTEQRVEGSYYFNVE